MKRIVTTLALAGLIGAGMQVMAADSSSGSSGSTMNTHQMMKDCMAKAKASNNGMSEKDMKKSCKEQIKEKAANPNESTGTVTPAH